MKPKNLTQLASLSVASLLLAGSLSACNSMTFTPQGTTATLKATSGNLSHSVTFKVSVQ